jgi:lipase chaperone LimK
VSPRATWAWAGTLVVALGAIAWRFNAPVAIGSTVLASVDAGRALSPAPGRNVTVPVTAEAPAVSEETATLAQWVQTRSVLRGTALDGGWGLDANGTLQPSLALRRRFDHVQQLQGQLNLAQITAYLTDLARQDLTPAQAAAVLQVWAHYLQLQQHPYQVVVRLDDPDSLAAALAERQQARRQGLGPDWAQAFYGEEEAALTEQILRPTSPAPAAGLIDRRALSPQAQQRLAAEEAGQAAFERKLAQAREAVGGLQQAPELSEVQRQQAVQNWLDAHFDAAEQRRVRALLSLAAS